MSINLNSRNNTLCCKVNDLYTALMASELLNDCVDDVVVMLETCVDYESGSPDTARTFHDGR